MKVKVNHLLDFNDLFMRTDEQLLEEILGAKTLRILATLDQTKVYNKYLRNLVLELYGAESLLIDKNFRSLLFDLLRENEVRVLAQTLGIANNISTSDLYNKVKEKPIRRGSSLEESLFNFFNLIPPPLEYKNIIASTEIFSPGYSLFKHQRKAVRNVKMLLNQQPYKVLLHMPTGSGKTRTAMNVIADHLREREPTIVTWLAASEELCEQAVGEFQKAWHQLGNRSIEIYRYWGTHKIDIKEVKDGFFVAGLPKMVQRIRHDGGIDFISRLANLTSLIIMDEAHQAIAPTYQTILEVLFNIGEKKELLGLSATPGRTWNDIQADAKLADFFSRRKVKLEIEGYANPIDYLTDQEYLARVNYRSLFYENGRISPQDLNKITESMDIPSQVLNQLGQDEQRNLKIIYEAENMIKRHKRIIIFAPSVDSSNLLASVLLARGHLAYSLTGNTNSIRRKKIIESYKDHEIQPKILCNYGILTTGFDAPETSAAIIARPTFSLVLYSQMIGRAIRGSKVGGNAEAEIVTLVDQDLPGFNTVANSFINWEDVWE